MKILFVVNPVSGGEDKEPFLNWAIEECQRYGWEHEQYNTTGDDDVEQLKKYIDDFSPERIASVGGDGTTLITAEALIHSKVPMGIIPLGSANGMAMELAVNPDPKLAFQDLVLSDVVASLDLIRVNNEYFCMHIGDVGVNAKIVNAYTQDGGRGMITYAKYFLSEVTNPSILKAKICTDTGDYEVEGVMIALANSRKYGTGVVLNRTGTPFDGVFEIVVVKEVNFDTLLKSGLTILNENFEDTDNSQVITCKHATIELEKESLLQLDGEVIGRCKTIQAEIIPACVRFITHQGNNLLT